jgi:hypothetical protein
VGEKEVVLVMNQKQNRGSLSPRRRKSLTEEQERVFDRMQQGLGFDEAAAAEGIDRDEAREWMRLGSAFEEIQREMLFARWESCKLMPIHLLRLCEMRLARIIESGNDADAIKASGLVPKLMKLLAPYGYGFRLSVPDQEYQNSRRDVESYWEEVEQDKRPLDSGRDRRPAGGARWASGGGL